MRYPVPELRRWVELALPELTAVIYQPQKKADAPRPRKPYAAIQLRSDSPLTATAEARTTDTPGTTDPDKVVEIHSHLREGLLRIDLFGDDAVLRARALQISIALEPSWSFLKGDPDADPPKAPIAVVPRSDVLDLTQLLDTSVEERAQVDFRVRWFAEASHEVDWIESGDAELEG